MNPYTYVIADIHGRFDLLEMAARKINHHATTHQAQADVICLGDYIDRGPQSLEVLQFLKRGSFTNGQLILLMGNHEQMFIDSQNSPIDYRVWLYNGGDTTVASLTENTWDKNKLVPWMEWLSGLPTLYTDPHRFYVHAGVNPLVPLNQQKKSNLLWIREQFLFYDKPFEKYIVHGHTPTDVPDVRTNRCNLDTGAFYTNKLSVGVFDNRIPGGPLEIIQIQNFQKKK